VPRQTDKAVSDIIFFLAPRKNKQQIHNVVMCKAINMKPNHSTAPGSKRWGQIQRREKTCAWMKGTVRVPNSEKHGVRGRVGDDNSQ
jgi:hypothetical protein